MAAKYIVDINNICSDASLPNRITPLQYQKGVTPDISAYLQFSFWQPVLYLDHEETWPSSKERSSRWVGIAHGIGDFLTFWILDDQSKHILAQSVVRPYKENLRVRWDPALANAIEKATATNANDVMPADYSPEPLQITETAIQDTPVHLTDNDSSILKQDYVNLGNVTSTLEVPKVQGPTTRSKGKLKLDNDKLIIDETIESFTRTRKKPYKEVTYDKKYVPPEFEGKVPILKPSEWLKDKPKTTWEAAKSRKTMHVNGRTLVVPSAIQAIPAIGLNKSSLFKPDPIPLSLDEKHEDLRAYHARLDMIQSIISPEQCDYDWQVENFIEWRYEVQGFNKEKAIALKVTWIGGDKQ